MTKAQIGIFGGSGFYNLLENAEEIEVDTPYGKPSDKITIGEYKGKKVAFLPRHGNDHRYPPHKVPYRANLWAFKELGVKYILGPCASGSLQKNIAPGDFVICDQFVDRTKTRKDTYHEGPSAGYGFGTKDSQFERKRQQTDEGVSGTDTSRRGEPFAAKLGSLQSEAYPAEGPNGPKVAHVEAAHPYCEDLRKIAVEEANKLGITVHGGGTVVVIQGPRFSTKAESRWFSSAGFEVINMPQYPECILARELEMCYVNICLITDYDVGLEGEDDIKPVTIEEVLKTFKQNNEKVKDLLFALIERIDTKRECGCHSAMKGAFLN